MRVPEGRLVIWTEAPPTNKPVKLQVVDIKDKTVYAEIDAEEFERTMQQWLALSHRSITGK